MINYSQHINEFSVERVIRKFNILHPHIKYDEKGFYEFLSDYKQDCCNPILSLNLRKENNKIYKDKLGGLMDSYCSKSVKYTGISFIDNMVKEYRTNPGNAELNSAIITILRIPNWPMLSDKELEILNKDKKPEDLGVLDTKTCPYNMEDVPLDLIDALNVVFPNVEKYINSNFTDQPSNLKNKNGSKMLFTCDDIVNAVQKVRLMVNGKMIIPEKLKPIIEYYSKLKKSKLVEIYRKNENGFQEDSFMETESGCPLNSYRSILAKINEKVSLGRISNTIGNYFVGDSKYINSRMVHVIPFRFYEAGLKVLMDCVDFSYGKGDAYKDRKIYILWTVIQNILGPTAKEWSHLQEKYGYEFIGTTHQHDKLNQLGTSCKDGLGIDYTQYSDFLFKGVFYEISTLIGFSAKESTEICELVSLPILYKGKLYPVKLASNMGAKIDFLLITEANLYMYLIGALISNRYSDDITVVGDDRWETKKNSYFDEREVYVKLQVACSFNCKLNPEKTSWMKRDGIFGGCHVWYNRFNLPSTGIAPSQLLKDFYQINDFNALINKVQDSGQSDIYTQDIIYSLIEDEMSQELLKMGNRRFGFKDQDLGQFLSNAYNIPYQFGGLGYRLEDLDPSFYSKPIFQNLLNILKADQTSDFDRFIKVFNLEENFITLSLNSRKGAKNYKDLVDLMNRLKQLNEPGLITNEFLQSIRKDLQKYFDLQRRLENRGRSTSTKNRRGLEFDADKLFRQTKSQEYIRVFDYKDDLMSKQLLMDYKNCKDKVFILRLLSYTEFMSRINGKINLYEGVGGCFWGLLTDEFPGRYIRLETKWNDRYPWTCVTKTELDNSPNRYQYIMIADLLKATNLYKELKCLLEEDIKEMKMEELQDWIKEEAFKMMLKD